MKKNHDSATLSALIRGGALMAHTGKHSDTEGAPDTPATVRLACTGGGITDPCLAGKVLRAALRATII